jgi:hypothetical protein
MTEQKRSEHGETGEQQTDIDQKEDLDVSEAQVEDVRGGTDMSPWTTTHGHGGRFT